MLKHFRTKSSHTYRKCDCSMHIVTLLIESNTAITATQMNKLNNIFCISLGWFNNALFGCRALANREKNAFRVTRPMFSRVVRVPRNELVETSSSSCLVICRRAFGVLWYEKRWFWMSMKMKFRHVFCVYWSVHQEMWQCCISLSVGFHFLLVKFVLKCGVDHTWQRTSASLIYERFHGH